MNVIAPASVRVLVAAIRVRQRRLGTPAERSEDFDEICRLAHALNNVRTAAQLMSDLGMDQQELERLQDTGQTAA